MGRDAHCPTAIYIQREEEEEEDDPFKPGTALGLTHRDQPQLPAADVQGERGSGAQREASRPLPLLPGSLTTTGTRSSPGKRGQDRDAAGKLCPVRQPASPRGLSMPETGARSLDPCSGWGNLILVTHLHTRTHSHMQK